MRERGERGRTNYDFIYNPPTLGVWGTYTIGIGCGLKGFGRVQEGQWARILDEGGGGREGTSFQVIHKANG